MLNGSLLAADFKPGQLPAGAKGDKGDPGPPGASEYQLVAQQKSVVNSTSNFDTVNCPAGKKAVGGGITSSPVSATQGPFVYFSRPTAPGTGWTAGTVRTAAGGWNIVVYAICVKVT